MLNVTARVQSHTLKFFSVEKNDVRRRGSGKLGEVFKSQSICLHSEASCISNSHYGRMHTVFCRLDYEVWKPTISFYIPLEQESTQASYSNHPQIIARAQTNFYHNQTNRGNRKSQRQTDHDYHRNANGTNFFRDRNCSKQLIFT